MKIRFIFWSGGPLYSASNPSMNDKLLQHIDTLPKRVCVFVQNLDQWYATIVHIITDNFNHNKFQIWHLLQLPRFVFWYIINLICTVYI